MSSSGTTSGSAEVQGACDRRSGGLHELVERVDVVLAESTSLVPGQDAEEALRPVLTEERQDEPGPDGIQSFRPDEVAGECDLDRPRAPVVGEAHPRNVIRLRLRQPDRRDDRRPVAAGDERDRALSSRALAGNLESAHHRLGVVADVEGSAARRLLERRERVVQRLGELRQPVVVTAQHGDRDLGLA